MTTSPTPTWMDAVRRFAAAHDVPAWVLDDLAAFQTPFPRGGPPAPPEPPFDGTFEDLEEVHAPPLDVAAITLQLSAEAEGVQPEMFARRVAAVERVLDGLGSPSARILRAGLRVRLVGIAGAPPPRLRRVRALADFYYSLAARLRHPEWVENERHLRDRVDTLRWVPVQEGLEHAVIDGLTDGMPVHVNVLRADLTRVHVDVADLQAETRAGRPVEQVVAGRAIAAISGGFFLYSEDDIALPSRRHDPVGLLLSGGVVVNPPVFRRAGLLVGDRGVALRRLDMRDVVVRVADVPVAIDSFHNRAEGPQGPDRRSIAVVGREVVATGRRLPIPLNGYVAALAAEAGSMDLRVGTTLTYGAPQVAGGAAHAGICGGPLIVDEGRPVLDMRAEDFWGTAPPITFSQDETGDRNLLARMVIGLDAEGRLLAAAIDGRNVQRALGMTLAGAARLMIQLGCVTAANMDGGSSKRMVIQGEVKDLPSTEIVAGEAEVTRVRPVHSAILFCDP